MFFKPDRSTQSVRLLTLFYKYKVTRVTVGRGGGERYTLNNILKVKFIHKVYKLLSHHVASHNVCDEKHSLFPSVLQSNNYLQF